jgi:hypothetical protein
VREVDVKIDFDVARRIYGLMMDSQYSMAGVFRVSINDTQEARGAPAMATYAGD